MKITIDTKEDSHEELRKVIRMLSSLVGEEVMSNQGDLFSDNTQNSDIFGDSSEAPSDSSETPSSQGGGSDMFSMFSNTSSETKTEPEETTEEKKEESDIDIPEVEEYR